MTALGVGLLGDLRLDVDGRRLGPGELGGRKPLPRDPMRTLEAYVSGLRSRLHPDPARARALLCREPGAYRLDLEGADVDLWRFDDLAARAAVAGGPAERRRLRTEALALVRGEVLADEPYADWALSLRDLYRERHSQLLLDMAADCLAEPDVLRALAHAEQVLVGQPARERAHRLVMAAHHLAGDRDRAVAAYDRCRRALDAELGVAPLPQTERLYLAVLNGDPLEGQPTLPAPAAPAPQALHAPRPRTGYARSGDTAVASRSWATGRSTSSSRSAGSLTWRPSGRSPGAPPSSAVWPPGAG